jgi:hypothetical protein
MKKLMFAALAMVSAFAVASGTQSSAQAAPTTTEDGACRYWCGMVQYRTAAACAAVCSTECDPVC